MKAWRCNLVEAEPDARVWLQLGHAGEGVEIATAENRRRLQVSLQLGHAGEGVEMANNRKRPARLASFNWATPVKAWR